MKLYKGTMSKIELKLIPCNIRKAKIKCSHNGSDYIRDLFNPDTLELRETFIVLLLNRANITTGYFVLSEGGMCGTVVDVRLLFATAISSGASAIMMAHNHPSGNTNPSGQDLSMTKKVSESGRLLDIPLLDHYIITKDSYYSFADEGRLH